MNTPPPDGHAAWPSVMARAYLGFTLRTTKWTVTGDRRAVPVLTQAEPLETKGAIVAFWHRSLLLLPALWTWAQQRQTGLRLKVMISRNRDGRLINDAVAPWGIIGIEGSSAKKGKIREVRVPYARPAPLYAMDRFSLSRPMGRADR